jgi:hypothetical protein
MHDRLVAQQAEPHPAPRGAKANLFQGAPHLQGAPHHRLGRDPALRAGVRRFAPAPETGLPSVLRAAKVGVKCGLGLVMVAIGLQLREQKV